MGGQLGKPEEALHEEDENRTVEYPGGGSYIGHFRRGYWDGDGVLTYSNGCRYEGNFERDVRQGKGTFTFTSGNEYRGEWDRGLPNGEGNINYANGDGYVGGFHDGLFNGKGKYEFAGGLSWYDGDWMMGKIDGFGTFQYAHGDSYEGEWENDQMHGRGVRKELRMLSDITMDAFETLHERGVLVRYTDKSGLWTLPVDTEVVDRMNQSVREENAIKAGVLAGLGRIQRGGGSAASEARTPARSQRSQRQ